MVKEEQFNARDINIKLLNAFREWEEKSCFMVVARENNLSRPYVCSVSERYPNSEKRIMIIDKRPTTSLHLTMIGTNIAFKNGA